MATYILLKELLKEIPGPSGPSGSYNEIEIHGLNSADTRSLSHNCGIANNASSDGILRFNSRLKSDFTIPKILNETSKLGYQVCAMSHHHVTIWTLVKHQYPRN